MAVRRLRRNKRCLNRVTKKPLELFQRLFILPFERTL
jgi:hypothetical protein